MIGKLFGQKQPEKLELPVPMHGGRVFEVNKWAISEFILNQLVPVVGIHPFPFDEQMLMTGAVCRLQPQLIFEWGTNIGKSARIFYEISEAFQIGCEIHSIDLPDEVFHNEHPKNDRGILVRHIPKVKLHQADGLKRSFEIIEKHPEKKRILFFVDGDHSYESVKRELSTILQQCPHANVLLHDTFFQTEESSYNTGPNRAVAEVLEGYANKYKTLSTNLGLPGMTLVYQ
jgi:cephalosporin hydroxylase